MLRTTITLCAVALLATGCEIDDDVFAPVDPQLRYATYTLKSVDGNTTPAAIERWFDAAAGDTVVHEFMSGYLRLDPDNTIKALSITRTRGVRGIVPTIVTNIPSQGEQSFGTFARSGDALITSGGQTLTFKGDTIVYVMTIKTGPSSAAVDAQVTLRYSR
jgi:hypothetical protein